MPKKRKNYEEDDDEDDDFESTEQQMQIMTRLPRQKQTEKTVSKVETSVVDVDEALETVKTGGDGGADVGDDDDDFEDSEAMVDDDDDGGDDDDDAFDDSEEDKDDLPKKKKKGDSKKTTKKSPPSVKKPTVKKSSKSGAEGGPTSKPSSNKTVGTKKPDKSGDGKAKVVKDISKIEEMLIDYLKRYNRPHAVQSIITGFHGAFTKTSCEKALSSLEDKQQVTVKQSGKAKVYYVNQNILPVVAQEELTAMDEEIKQKAQYGKQLQEEVKRLEKEKNEAQSSLTNSELKTKIVETKDKIKKKEEKLQSLQTTPLISDQELKVIQDNLDKYLREWKKRKAIGKDIVDKITEARDMTVDAFIEELGLESDPVDIKTIGTLLK
jgi:26S proteasome regulatory subunit (ATPase 3-interacting protein)